MMYPLKFSVFVGLAALAAVAFAAPPAQATVAFSPTNSPTGGEQNIQFEVQAMTPELTITGDTNQTKSPVIFDTTFAAGVSLPGGQPNLGGPGTGQMIAADGLGQANVQACSSATACGPNGPNGVQLTSLEMKPGAGFGWTDVVANPDFGEGTMNVWVADNLGNNFDFTLTNGSNFFTLTASGGEVITDVQMTQQTGTAGPFGWNDFKQPRVSGVCTLVGTTCTALPVPEPGSLALLGTALAGWGWAWRRRQRARPAASGVA